MQDRERKFQEVVKFNNLYNELPNKLAEPALKSIAESYVANMENLRSLGLMPLLFVKIASARHEGSKRYVDDLLGVLPDLPEVPKKFRDEESRIIFEKYIVSQNNLRQAMENFLRDHNKEWHPEQLVTFDVGAPDVFVRRVIEDLSLVELGSKISIKNFAEGVDSTLASMLVGAWTAFESLATDTWLTAVNTHPEDLGTLAIASQAPSKGGDGDNKISFTIDSDTLREYGYDLSACIGTMLYRKKKFGFNSLNDIKDSYNQTFYFVNNGKRTPSPELKKWFPGDIYNKMSTLEFLRHIFVHKAGQVDNMFLERMKGKDERFSKLKAGVIAPLDGVVVRDLIEASIRGTSALIEGVDKWLAKLKKSAEKPSC